METRPWIRVARTNRKTILALRAGGGKGGNLMGFTPDKQYLASHRALCVAPRANDAPAAEEEKTRRLVCVYFSYRCHTLECWLGVCYFFARGCRARLFLFFLSRGASRSSRRSRR